MNSVVIAASVGLAVGRLPIGSLAVALAAGAIAGAAARLAMEIAECLQTRFEAKGVGVVLEAKHLCMSLRGAEVTGARTVTSTLEGIVRDDPRTRVPGLTLRRSG